jgi:hypothetical protein
MRFNLDSYATVAERLAKFHQDFPNGRIVTDLISQNDLGNGKMLWVVKASVFLTDSDQANNLAKATGFAAEVDGSGGANNVAALPNAETSAVGRSLMIMGYSMNKDPNTLASREEMEKVNRGKSPAQSLDSISDVTELRRFYAQRKAAGATEEELVAIQLRATEFDSGSQDKGTGRSGSRGKAKE